MNRSTKILTFGSLLLVVGLFLLYASRGRSATEVDLAAVSDPTSDAPSLPAPHPVQAPDDADLPRVEERCTAQDLRVLDERLHACEPELLAADCPAPMEFPPNFHSPEVMGQAVEDKLASCPETEGLVVDCTEFPCLILGREDAFPALQQCFGLPDPEPGDIIRGDGPLSVLMSPWAEPPPDWLAAAAERRAPGRLARANEAAGTDGIRLPSARYDGVCGVSDLEGLDCPALLRLLSCEADPNITAADAQAHIDQAYALVEEWEATCEVFGESDWFVDCSELPCVVGMPNRPERPRQRCDLEGFPGEYSVIQSGHTGVSVTTVALTTVGPPHLGDALKQRWDERRSLRNTDALSHVVSPKERPGR